MEEVLLRQLRATVGEYVWVNPTLDQACAEAIRTLLGLSESPGFSNHYERPVVFDPQPRKSQHLIHVVPQPFKRLAFADEVGGIQCQLYETGSRICASRLALREIERFAKSSP